MSVPLTLPDDKICAECTAESLPHQYSTVPFAICEWLQPITWLGDTKQPITETPPVDRANGTPVRLNSDEHHRDAFRVADVVPVMDENIVTVLELHDLPESAPSIADPIAYANDPELYPVNTLYADVVLTLYVIVCDPRRGFVAVTLATPSATHVATTPGDTPVTTALLLFTSVVPGYGMLSLSVGWNTLCAEPVGVLTTMSCKLDDDPAVVAVDCLGVSEN